MSVEPCYRIETDATKGVIRMTFSGFWDTATATAFAGELDLSMERLAKAGIKPGEYLYLADFSESAVQSPIMVERFQRFAASAGTQARRIAVLAASTLQKMQAQRMAVGYDHYRFFLVGERQAAEAWLLANDPIPKPA